MKKSKYHTINIIKSIVIDKYNININCFYDTQHKGNRYSYNISYPGGAMANGGYGENNCIVHPTLESILSKALEQLPIDITREYKINEIIK
jgi:hypothetical protein